MCDAACGVNCEDRSPVLSFGGLVQYIWVLGTVGHLCALMIPVQSVPNG